MVQSSGSKGYYSRGLSTVDVGPDEVTVSVAQVANLCGVSLDTVRRRLRGNQLEGARSDGPLESSPRSIPVSALVKAGLCVEGVREQLDERLDPDLNRLASKVADINAELLAERTRREASERLLSQANSEIIHLRHTVERLLPELVSTSARRTA